MALTDDRLLKALRLKHPLIVAPMAGGPSSVDLVAATSNAGALGSIGAAYLSAIGMQEIATQIRSKTEKPYAINLFIPSSLAKVPDERLKTAIAETQKFRDEFGLPPPKLEPPYEEDFDHQFDATIAARPEALSFIFGTLSKEHIKEARNFRIYIMGTATNIDEACELEATGANAIVLQGIEAGGHRGTFKADSEKSDQQLPLLQLIEKARTKLKVPVIGAGGIMTAADIQKTLQAGAAAVQMGTAFLATKEAGTSAAYRKKLLESAERSTRFTRAFSGRRARGIVNRFMEEMDARSECVLPFPAQNKFTRDLRNASAAAGSADFLSLWCGTGRGDLWTGSAAELIETLFPTEL